MALKYSLLRLLLKLTRMAASITVGYYSARDVLLHGIAAGIDRNRTVMMALMVGVAMLIVVHISLLKCEERLWPRLISKGTQPRN